MFYLVLFSVSYCDFGQHYVFCLRFWPNFNNITLTAIVTPLDVTAQILHYALRSKVINRIVDPKVSDKVLQVVCVCKSPD